MTQQDYTQHPITPPPELVEQWLSEHYGAVSVAPGEATSHVAAQAAQWGADRELEACCEWMRNAPFGFSLSTSSYQLRNSRRPKLPSLKEQALAALSVIEENTMLGPEEKLIRRALEQLPDAL